MPRTIDLINNEIIKLQSEIASLSLRKSNIIRDGDDCDSLIADKMSQIENFNKDLIKTSLSDEQLAKAQEAKIEKP